MTSQIIPLSFVLLNLESVERKSKKQKQKQNKNNKKPKQTSKQTKFEYLKNKKSFLDKI